MTDKQIESALESLRTAGIVCLYEVDGKPYLQLRTWEMHQTIRAKKSKYPTPDSGKTTNENICMHLHADERKCPRNPIQSESNPTREMSIKSCAEFYERTFGAPLPGALSSEIIFRIGTGTDEKLVMEALKLCYGKDNPATYFAKVLQNWCAKGISTYQDYCKSNCTQTSFKQRKESLNSESMGIEGLEEL